MPVLGPEQFDPHDPATQQHPYDWYAALRRDTPVLYVPARDLWFVTARDAVTAALAEPEVFSSRFGLLAAPPATVADRVAAIRDQGWPYVPTLLSADQPTHDYYRRLVAGAFTARSVARWESTIRGLVCSALDGLMDGRERDWVAGFAIPLSLRTIAAILCVEDDRLNDFRRWSQHLTSGIGNQLDDAGWIRRAEQQLEFQRYFADQLESRRTCPGDDLLSNMVLAHIEEKGQHVPLDMTGYLCILGQLLAGGQETTTGVLAATLQMLASQSRLWEWLSADAAARAAPVIEETIRLASPVQGMYRITTRTTTLAGVTIPAGARVVLCYASANRDAHHLTNPDTLDPTRAHLTDHLAFGHGVHYCLGAPLARLQLRIALQEVAQRFDMLKLAPDQQYRYRPSFLLRGLQQLRMTAIPRSPALLR